MGSGRRWFWVGPWAYSGTNLAWDLGLTNATLSAVWAGPKCPPHWPMVQFPRISFFFSILTLFFSFPHLFSLPSIRRIMLLNPSWSVPSNVNAWQHARSAMLINLVGTTAPGKPETTAAVRMALHCPTHHTILQVKTLAPPAATRNNHTPSSKKENTKLAATCRKGKEESVKIAWRTAHAVPNGESLLWLLPGV